MFWCNDATPVHHSCVVFVSHSNELTSVADHRAMKALHMLLNCMEPHRHRTLLRHIAQALWNEP